MMHRIFISICLLLSFSLFGFAQTTAARFAELMQAGLELEKNMKEKEAFAKFKEAQSIYPTNLPVLYKCSELCSRIGNREADKASRDKYYNAALAFGKMALKYHPQSDDAYLSMSIAMGRIALTKSGKEKIISVKEIKSYAEKAIQLNPSNYKAWHVLGKWHYEVSNLNFMEKTAVKLFFGGLPQSSFQQSVNCYEKAKSLSQFFCLNYLELAKALHENGNEQQAINTLTELTLIPNYTEDDARIKLEAKSLLQSWQ